MAESIDTALLRDIVAPDDCPGSIDLPVWADLLINGAVLFTNPFLAIGVIAGQVGVDLLRSTCFSKVRIAAMITATKRNLPEAVPVFIALLGGEFVEGVQLEDGHRTVIFRLNGALANPFPAVRLLATAGIGQIMGSTHAAELPVEVFSAARATLSLAKQDPDRTVAVAAAMALVRLDVSMPQPTTPSRLRGVVPWLLAGFATIGAGALWWTARRHDRQEGDPEPDHHDILPPGAE